MITNNKFKKIISWIKTLQVSVLLSVAFVPHASAHLMVAQHGTLNFKGNGVFMVLSLPVSAFENIDDDGDGKMSSVEFSKHQPSILTAVRDNVRLSDKEGEKPLQGLLLTPVASHDIEKDHADQLIIMGRFALSSSFPLSKPKEKLTTTQSDELIFHAGLFGDNPEEQILEINSTRTISTNEKKQKFKVVLTPQQPESQLFKQL